jgi:HPt (histidine-containing phosphotransfer) domain-containing protein
MTHPDPIDWDQALTTVGGDAELLKELLGVYLGEANQMIRQMKSAVDAGDRSLLRRCAHTLKGASMSMAATATTAQAEILEQGCEDMNAQQLSEQLEAVNAATQEAIAAIEARLASSNPE